jgi:hypothetical protein
MIQQVQRPATQANGRVEHDARFGLRRAVHAISLHVRERPPREHRKAVVPLVPFDAGRKDVVKPERRSELARLVDEVAPSCPDVDLLQRNDVDVHRPQFRGEHIHRR